MTIGPVDFEIVFQVVDMDTSYNFHLGRPWIHTARAVPSTLYQMLKFEYDRQEIIIHWEKESSIYKDPLIPYIEAKKGYESIVYQAFEVVVVDRVEQEKPILHPCLSSTSVMVAALMLRQRYEPGKGLGHHCKEFRSPFLCSITRPRLQEGQNSSVQENIDEICHGLSQIFSKVNMIQAGFFVNAGFNNMKGMRNSHTDLKKLSNFEKMHQEVECDEDEAVEEIKRELEQFENKDVSAWSYDDMPGLSVDLVVYKLPKFVRYTTLVANVVVVPKKAEKARVSVDYRDLNKASPKDNIPLPNIHILVNNYAKHEIQSFVDCYAGYHQILMDEDNAGKTVIPTPWGTYCYRVMPFGLKNARATYMSTMTTIFHDMMYKEIEVYVDDVIIKSKTQVDHVRDLKKFFEGKKEESIYYLSKKLTTYEVKYTLLERTCCVLTQVAQKLRNYLLAYTTYLIFRMDPLKYIFQKPMPTGRLATWKILLTEFDIVYVTRTVMKAQALADHLVENPVDDEYKPLSTYFPNKEVNPIEEVVLDDSHVWKIYFDVAVNIKGVGIGAILISPIGQHCPAMA
ncbi:uncharacterized protein [Nicotiana sylvestris]|uniref:uncharacterized protein n=1 Tax=Nicotiana sylvestris TaxID=4096 RepID=UPI00388C5F73